MNSARASSSWETAPLRFTSGCASIRTNATFHRLLRIARLILAGDWQSTMGGDNEGFALLFPMNQLFEEFVGRTMKRALAPRSVRLQGQREIRARCRP